MNDDTVPAENSKTAEVVVPETTENADETAEQTESTDVDWKARAEKAEELANNYKIRAEKAEKKAPKSDDAPTKTTDPYAMSSLDAIALAKSDVHEDDLDRVVKFAKTEGISIKEALKNDDLKAILSNRSEKRKTAAATNTGTARRGSVKLSDEEIVERANRGELPEDPTVLAKAQHNLKTKKRQ